MFIVIFFIALWDVLIIKHNINFTFFLKQKFSVIQSD